MHLFGPRSGHLELERIPVAIFGPTLHHPPHPTALGQPPGASVTPAIDFFGRCNLEEHFVPFFMKDTADELIPPKEFCLYLQSQAAMWPPDFMSFALNLHNNSCYGGNCRFFPSTYLKNIA